MEIIEPGGPEVVRFAERDEPAPGPGQVTIRVEYAGLNFVDVLARRGVPGYFTGWPFVPGMEVGGTIHALGEGVDTSRPGTGWWHLRSMGPGWRTSRSPARV